VSSIKTELSVIAVVQEEDRLRAVEVQKGPTGLQVVWAKSSEAGQIDWTQFASECGLTVSHPHAGKEAIRPNVVIGLRPVGVAFYRLQLPQVPQAEMEAMVRMQAESRLPLSLDQMELAWRITGRGSEQVDVTLAAIRRKQAQSLIDQVRPLAPERVVLSSEALVKAWTTVFADAQQDDSVVIGMDGRSTLVCLVENGLLSHMAVIDMGTEALVGEHLGVPSAKPDQTEGQTGIEEQFIQDLKAILEGFPRPLSKDQDWPVVILSDGSPVLEYIAGLLRGAGLKVGLSTPKTKTIQATFSPGQWYEYKTALGLALMWIESPASTQEGPGLDLFMGLYRPPGEEDQRKTILSTRTATVIAAAALIGMLLISYLTDMALAHRLTGLVEQHKLVDLKALRDARQAVAGYRPDVLALLKEINAMIPATEGILGRGDRGGLSRQGMPPASSSGVPSGMPSGLPSGPESSNPGMDFMGSIGRGDRGDSSGQGPSSEISRRDFMGRGRRGDRSVEGTPFGVPSGPGGESGTGGIVLNSLIVRRGQAIQIDGQADRPEQVYAFEQTLQKKAGIQKVEITKSVPDNQTRKVKFTVKFQYKNFTQKGAR